MFCFCEVTKNSRVFKYLKLSDSSITFVTNCSKNESVVINSVDHEIVSACRLEWRIGLSYMYMMKRSRKKCCKLLNSVAIY